MPKPQKKGKGVLLSGNGKSKKKGGCNGSKKCNPCQKRGMGFWSDLRDGFISGITLGAVRPGKSKDISFLPLGEKGFLKQELGVSGSDIATVASAVNPELAPLAAGLSLVEKGQKKKAKRAKKGSGSNSYPNANKSISYPGAGGASLVKF